MTDGVTIDAIISSIPQRFRKEKSANYETIVHFVIDGDSRQEFSVIIEKEMCRVVSSLEGEPKCVVKTKDKHYVGLELGSLNPQLAILTGKIKVSNINEMLTFSKCFYPFSKFIQKQEVPQTKKDRKPTQGPLLGYRILDLSRLLPGPWATAMLADMGAEVIKIEDPDAPDYVRDFPPMKDGKSVNYMVWNRSKRSLALSVRTEEGKKRFLALVKSADVVVEQFRPGAINSWGIGYEEAKKHNPGIIYVSLTGYGQSGPLANAAGHDINYLALSGVLSQNKDASGRPIIPGVQLADIASGTYQTVQAVMAALLSKMKTGVGQYVDVAMTDGLLPMATISLNQFWTTGKLTDNQEASLSGQLPNYNVYETKDSKWVALGALEPKFWTRFCEITNKLEWREKAIPSHPELAQVKKEVAELFKSQPRMYWEKLGSEEEICLTPVLELDELEAHPHFQARKMFDYSTSLPLIQQPIKFGATPSQVQWEAPELGEDNL